MRSYKMSNKFNENPVLVITLWVNDSSGYVMSGNRMTKVLVDKLNGKTPKSHPSQR